MSCGHVHQIVQSSDNVLDDLIRQFGMLAEAMCSVTVSEHMNGEGVFKPATVIATAVTTEAMTYHESF